MSRALSSTRGGELNRSTGSGRCGFVAVVSFWLASVMTVMAAPQAEGYERVGFDRLAGFSFVPPSPDLVEAGARAEGQNQIPADIKALDGRKTLITGFMLPVRLANGRVTEFLLVRDPSLCCYGVVPAMNEWVVVKMKSGGVAPVMDVPISFYGELKVGPQFENGYMVGIYELVGERMGEVGG
jgi:hypothetical protein